MRKREKVSNYYHYGPVAIDLTWKSVRKVLNIFQYVRTMLKASRNKIWPFLISSKNGFSNTQSNLCPIAVTTLCFTFSSCLICIWWILVVELRKVIFVPRAQRLLLRQAFLFCFEPKFNRTTKSWAIFFGFFQDFNYGFKFAKWRSWLADANS